MICCFSAVYQFPFKSTYYSIFGKECLVFDHIICCSFRMYCLASYTLPLGPNNKTRQIVMVCFNVLLTNTHRNLLGLTKMGKYKYEYILFKQKMAYTNMNIFRLRKRGKYQYVYKYSDWYSQIRKYNYSSHTKESAPAARAHCCPDRRSVRYHSIICNLRAWEQSPVCQHIHTTL